MSWPGVISAKIVQARKPHICDNEECPKGRSMFARVISTGEDYVRVYGAAHSGDPPHVLRFHLGNCYHEPEKCTQGQRKLCWDCRTLQPVNVMMAWCNGDPMPSHAQCSVCGAGLGQVRTR